MEKDKFYKFLADLEDMSEMQLITVKGLCESLLGNKKPLEPYPTNTPGVSPYVVTKSNIPECCKNCPNFKDGAICHCTLPYMTQTGDGFGVTYTEKTVPPVRTITTNTSSDIDVNPNLTVSLNSKAWQSSRFSKNS